MQEATIDTVELTTTDSIGSDSVYSETSLNLMEVLPATSLFEGHQLQDGHGLSYLEKPDLGTGFGFVVILIYATIIVYLQRSSDGIFGSLFKASFDWNLTQQQARLENSQQSRNLLILQVIGVISIALFVTGGLIQLAQLDQTFPMLFAPVLGAMVAFVLFKRFALWFLSLIFDLSGELKVHNFNLNILFAATGMSLLPLSLVLFYTPSIPTLGVAVLGAVVGILFYLKGLQRGILVALNSSSISTLHLFYYFCALEILPVFVLIRFAQGL